ncbi:FtsK/SpoIIIE domain-containing protein [Frankia sp. AiPa1]|nr:FtsK/SpoIIIE domain-containing protein [Frankia sp. AiPa1]
MGAPRSGRSTALRSIAGSIADALSARDVHLYGLDFGGGALIGLTDLPHTGALVERGDVDRVVRLLNRLAELAGQRRRHFAARGVSDLREARQTDMATARPPYLLVLIDGLEGFLADFEDVDGGDTVDVLLRLLREGPAAGIRVILSADRRGLTGRFAALVAERLVLRLADPTDGALAGISAADMPEHQPPGRGVVIGGRYPDPVEVQVGLLDPDPAGRAQVAALRAVAGRAQVRTGRDPSCRPFRVEPLPEQVAVAQLRAALRARPAPSAGMPAAALRIPLGLGGDDLEVVEIDLSADPGFVVGGPPRSGRSSVLLAVATALLDREVPLVIVTPRPSPLRALNGRPGVLVLADDELSDLAWPQPGARPPWAGPPGTRTPAILVDDAELVAEPAAGALAEHWRQARGSGAPLVLAGSTEDLLLQYRGFAVDVRRDGHGLLLAPRRATDGDLLGVRLPRAPAPYSPPGRGLLLHRGRMVPVQVAGPVTANVVGSSHAHHEGIPYADSHHPGSDAGRLPDEPDAARTATNGH